MSFFAAWKGAANAVSGEYRAFGPFLPSIQASIEGAEVSAKGTFFRKQTYVCASTPLADGLVLVIQEKRHRAPGWLEPVEILGGRFALEFQVFSNQPSVSQTLLDTELCSQLFCVDEFDRYEFGVRRGLCYAQRRYEIESDPGILIRVMRAVACLSSRPEDLCEAWRSLATELKAESPRRQAWGLGESDQICVTRQGLTVRLQAQVASPGEPLPPRLYTRVSCKRTTPGTSGLLLCRQGVERPTRPRGQCLELSGSPYLAYGQGSKVAERCLRSRALSRCAARYVMVSTSGVELWFPGIVDVRSATLLIEAAVSLAGSEQMGAYR